MAFEFGTGGWTRWSDIRPARSVLLKEFGIGGWTRWSDEFGTGGRTRTGTLFTAGDFESPVSTNFTTLAQMWVEDYNSGFSEGKK